MKTNTSPFKVSTPPESAKTQDGRGRPSKNKEAVAFCRENLGQWCELFTEKFNKNDKALHQARVRMAQNKRAMRLFAERNELNIEFKWDTDKNRQIIVLWAKTTTKKKGK